MSTQEWYENLIKPSFAPPSWLFGPVWTVLYTGIFITYSYIVIRVIKGTLPKTILIPLSLNLISNLIFSPIQFGLQNNLLAALDISIVLITLIWLILSLIPHSKLLVFAQIPYLLWVSFATLLQYLITWLNR